MAPASPMTTTITAPAPSEPPAAVARPALTTSFPATTTLSLSDTALLTATSSSTDQAGLAATPEASINRSPLFTATATLADAVMAGVPLSTPVGLPPVIAIVPDVDINLYSEANEKSLILRTLRAPEQLTVLQADAYWVQGITSDGAIGWVEAYWLTYTGDTAQLPRALQYRVATTPVAVEQSGSKIPFSYGKVISAEGATSYPLLDDPDRPASQLTVAPVGADVTLLFSATGPAQYDSTTWYYVQMSDPAGQNVLWQGYLPAAVIEPR